MEARAQTEATLAAYAREADLYAELTDASDFAWWHASVRAQKSPPARLLDLGCGGGRDLMAFTALGYAATGIEGCAALAESARRKGACVTTSNLIDASLGEQVCEVITANAVLQHLPASLLTRSLADIHRALTPSGVLVALVPQGEDEEGWARGRYVRHLRAHTWRALLAAFTAVSVTPRERWLLITARTSA